MLSGQIRDLANGIGALAGTVDEGVWWIMVGIRSNLRSIADQVEQVEAHFVIPEREQEGGKDVTASH